MKTVYKGNGFCGNKSIFTVRSFNELETFVNLPAFKSYASKHNRKIIYDGVHVINGRKCEVYHLHYTKTKYYFRQNKLVARETWSQVYYKDTFYQIAFDQQMKRINEETVKEQNDQKIINRAVCIGIELHQYGQGKKNREELSVITQDVLKMIEAKY